MTSTKVESFHRTREDREAAEARIASHGGGGYDGGDMEERIRHLEQDMSYIKGKLEDMPTKDWMTVRLIAVVGCFAAITGLVQFLLTV